METHECGSGSVSPLQDQGSDWIGMKIDVSDVIDRLLLVLGAKNTSAKREVMRNRSRFLRGISACGSIVNHSRAWIG